MKLTHRQTAIDFLNEHRVDLARELFGNRVLKRLWDEDAHAPEVGKIVPDYIPYECLSVCVRILKVIKVLLENDVQRVHFAWL